MAVGSLGGRTVVVGDALDGPTVATLAGGRWTVDGKVVGRRSGRLRARFPHQSGGRPYRPPGAAVVIGGSSTPDALFSRDGISWSDQPLSLFVGTSIAGISSVVVTTNRAIVTVELPNPQVTGPAHQVVIVGTPA